MQKKNKRSACKKCVFVTQLLLLLLTQDNTDKQWRHQL